MKNYLSLSYLGSISALGVATCCVLPMIMILLGLGGSWLAIFGKIAATGYYVLTISTVLVFISWLVSHKRGSMKALKWWLGGSTALIALAWVVLLNEARINDSLIMWM